MWTVSTAVVAGEGQIVEGCRSGCGRRWASY